MTEKVNSRNYWNNRFLTDWKIFAGNEQTKYFAEILCEMLPKWLIHEANEKKYSICDLGCAEGDALRIYREYFTTSKIEGEDFSDKAIENAKNNYPEFNFKTSDILIPESENKYEIIICSNVLEHFRETYHVLEKICERSERFAIIMFPYREESGKINEHEKSFHAKDIPMLVGNHHLVYAKSMECNSEYYPYEQIVLVYAKGGVFSLLSEITENVSSNREIEKVKLLHELGIKFEKKEKEITGYRQKLEEKEKEVTEYCHKLEEKEVEFSAYSKRLEQENATLEAVLCQKDEYMSYAQKMCMEYAESKIMKLNHLKNRIVRQLIRGNKRDRKDFWEWCKGRKSPFYKIARDAMVYNPWQMTNEILKDGIACRKTFLNNKDEVSEKIEEKVQLETVIKDILNEDYTKTDVIILSVIDYNFRHQRPQHFATRFALNGHRVFYINANFIRPDFVKKESENLYVVDFLSHQFNTIYATNGLDSLSWMKEKFEDLIYSQAIRDAVIIVDYPNWVYAAEAIREKYGFKIVTDYMDDYTGFLGTTEDFLKENCIRLLKESDAVVASSQFLVDVAKKYIDDEKITIIRNATEVEHFHQAISLRCEENGRKVVGYYGAVSHWFDWEKVCYVAKTFPEYDIVVIGEVTAHRKELEKYPNIRLLGEKPYKELPKYLADFDVCLIPFDTSTDLIKATNPVKFYEYLSAGKKVVATEIPELMPYKDEYVYMSNSNEEFAMYVKMCVEGKDSLKTSEKCIEFAQKNDWQHRYELFSKVCSNVVPKVSIIVLTYNNLDLNKKCICSILKKTAYADYELLIVDNQSTDGTVEYLKELEAKNIPNVKIMFNNENLGFAAGNNIGIDASKGEYIVLLNNDTVVTRGWLTSLVKHLENNSRYGMCNPVTNSIGNESMIKVRYYNETEMHEFAYIETNHSMGRTYLDVDRLPLFATIIRKKVIEQVGKLDEAYKIGMFEDDDYTEAVKKAGYEIVIAEDSFIHHVNNASFKKLDPVAYQKIFEENKSIFEKKWDTKWTMPHYREGVFANSNEGMGI